MTDKKDELEKKELLDKMVDSKKTADKKPAKVEKKPAKADKKPAKVEKKPAKVEKKPAKAEKKPADEPKLEAAPHKRSQTTVKMKSMLDQRPRGIRKYYPSTVKY